MGAKTIVSCERKKAFGISFPMLVVKSYEVMLNPVEGIETSEEISQPSMV